MIKAVVLLSGGLDSATALYWARRRGWECYCLIFDYSQRHRKEVRAAKRIAAGCGCDYKVLKIALPWGGSSLLKRDSRLPSQSLAEIYSGRIPSTYVPARNTIFLSYALSWAEVLKASRIVIGANCLDFSGYPDCRPDYFASFKKVARYGTGFGRKHGGIEIVVPLLKMNKAGIIKLGMGLNVPYGSTWSCYKGAKIPCGSCDSCKLRARGFAEAGVKDPLPGSGRK